METSTVLAVIGILVPIGATIGIFMWSRREKLEAHLIPGTPNFGPDHIRISFRLVNEGKRSIEVLGAEAKFDDAELGGEQPFRVGERGFGHGRHAEPGKTHENNARIPIQDIGEEWRKLRNPIPVGSMRLRVRFGRKSAFTSWEPTN